MADPSVLFAAAQAHYRAGRIAEAQARCERLLAEAPGHGGAMHLRGLIAFQAGEKAQAARLFCAAAALALAAGDGDMALRCAVEALTAQETPQARRLFAAIASALRFSQDDPVVRPLLARAIAEEWGPLAPLAIAAAGLVKAKAAAGGGLAEDELLRVALAAAPVADAGLEAALTAARYELLERGGDANFAAALAQQCFLGGYVFAETREETAMLARLRGETTPQLLALACYRPLGETANAESFAAADDALAPVLKQQRDGPAEEKRLAAALPVLTPIGAANWGETPWPRWSGNGTPEAPMALRDYLSSRFPAADLVSVPQKPEMLSTGCGTGQYALHLARALVLESVTAIDLSRANLAFAARKAAEAGLAIRFGQGDILEVASLNQSFGLIECGGVLHQLANPYAGWRALLAVLDPSGVMRLAVHSARAQQAFTPVRDLALRKGFTPTPDGIRAARSWLKARRDDSLKPALEAPEFFTLGGCRHLLFPAAEHPLALGDIAGFLRANGLALIGLDVATPVMAAYRARFPQDEAATDLDNWAAFEQENPRIFAAMIQFWVQKRG
jgi:ubiquinone/menaquinone biosynthesis C-methylase UbiE